MSADSSLPYIPLSVPEIRGNEWTYVKECLDTGWVSSAGPFVDRFEQEIAGKLGTAHAVACQSGTAALHVALQVAGIGPGDAVFVPTLTFIAPTNAVCYVGATPILVDIEPDHWCLDLDLVEHFLRTRCRREGRRTIDGTTEHRVAGIVPVHLLGHPADMNRLMTLAAEFDLAVIEDATESLGASYRGRPTGVIGDLGCLSFNGNKILTTGGGGMILTGRADWATRAKHLTNQAKVDPIEYLHDEIGYNYRLTNVQAAMGLAQLEQLDAFVAAKRNIAHSYCAAFADLPGIEPMRAADWADSSWWMFTVLVRPDLCGINSRTLMRRLENSKIQSRPLWRPLHLGPPHGGCRVLGGAVAERVAQMALSLPCSVGLTVEQQTRVVDVIRHAVAK